MLKSYLIDEDLYLDNVKEYENIDLQHVNLPDTIGIASRLINGNREYMAYLNDDRGRIKLHQIYNSFDVAILKARYYYEGLLSYYRGIQDDFAGINRH